ncbi:MULTISPECIES: hypothetical protein [unclassified Sulfitobacter]|uniref:hypothetical protein n=1 Tax=unclassified Sulfitobacter TaxID=196795 RepID=UPI0007C23CDD|nr:MULTISPECIES: hypothetical protein [unclassified Sulfitobacter]KZX98060.1 hypothetical protein A3721_06860 [Sulfitobacter sp. HI0023]KZY26829.1 hypothetical protein A3728_14765 [Sulfitobacter sp. HI0040]KZZ67316.1 hypothetical protein A3764_15225 [Sulfitobacter sp. HI0129]
MVLKRGASVALIKALTGHFYPVLLTYADWPGETVRIHTGVGTLAWNGQSWLGAGKLVQFQAPEESTGIATSEASVRVAATIEGMLAERGKIIRNRTVTVWFGVTTEPGGNVLAQEPVQLFNGYFDSRSGTLTRNGEDQMHDMVLGLGTGPSARSAASVTHSYEAQIAQYPTDTAGRHVQNANKHLYNPQRWPE